jgi:hypothetical protein
MVLLHTHEIHLHPEHVSPQWQENQRDGVAVLHADTRRGVAAVIAKLWSEVKREQTRPPDEQCGYKYWYWQYCTQMPYEMLCEVPVELMPRLLELRQTLAWDPRVVAVVEED